MNAGRMISIILLVIFPVCAFSVVHVKGYLRKDGTYVRPHYRSDPNGTVLDNWSTKGNVNPYTGKEGTKNPYTGYDFNSTIQSIPDPFDSNLPKQSQPTVGVPSISAPAATQPQKPVFPEALPVEKPEKQNSTPSGQGWNIYY